MEQLRSEVISFFKNQQFVVISTLDQEGNIHCAAKGIVGIEPLGQVFLIDVYRGSTFQNLQKDSRASITAVNGHKFMGYSLQGTAKIIEREEIKSHIIEEWEQRIISRISDRLIKNVQDQNPLAHHPEAKLPPLQYLIEFDAEKVVDLAPKNLKKQKSVNAE